MLVLFRVLSLPGRAPRAARRACGWRWPAPLGIFVSATISMRDERLSPAGSYTDATGRPVPAPPEIQLLPAPPRGDGA